MHQLTYSQQMKEDKKNDSTYHDREVATNDEPPVHEISICPVIAIEEKCYALIIYFSLSFFFLFSCRIEIRSLFDQYNFLKREKLQPK